MNIPAFCDRCGAAFRSGIRVASGVKRLTLLGNTSRCPRCGGLGRIPDGAFDFADGVIRVLAAPQQTVDDLRTLAVILEDARKGKINRADAVRGIETAVPSIRKAVRLLQGDEKTWRERLLLLIAVTGVLLTAKGRSQPITITNVVNVPAVERSLSEQEVELIMERVFERLCSPREP